MFTRLFTVFVLGLALLLSIGESAEAQRKTALGGDGVVPLNFNAEALNTPLLFVDILGNRVCGVIGFGPVTVSCAALPITIPAGAPVVALNPFDVGLRVFVVGTGANATQVCVVTSNPTVGTTVCTGAPF